MLETLIVLVAITSINDPTNQPKPILTDVIVNDDTALQTDDRGSGRFGDRKS